MKFTSHFITCITSDHLLTSQQGHRFVWRTRELHERQTWKRAFHHQLNSSKNSPRLWKFPPLLYRFEILKSSKMRFKHFEGGSFGGPLFENPLLLCTDLQQGSGFLKELSWYHFLIIRDNKTPANLSYRNNTSEPKVEKLSPTSLMIRSTTMGSMGLS